jgi:hypothetical protein
VSTLDHTLEPKASSVRRLEVITGTGRRRRFFPSQLVRPIGRPSTGVWVMVTKQLSIVIAIAVAICLVFHARWKLV